MVSRRRSRDSSDSDSDSWKHKSEGGFPSPLVFGGVAAAAALGSQSQTPLQAGPMHEKAPPAYGNPVPPLSGYRIPLNTDKPFVQSNLAGQPPCVDADGHSPVFIGSALFGSSVHPCKIAAHLNPPASVPYAGQEYAHHGRYDLLPFDPQQMEFVPTAHGQIPAGRRPIEGGYEESGPKLYHAIGVVDGVRVPGKTGEHLYVRGWVSQQGN